MSANDLRDEIIIKSPAGVGLREIEETVIEPSALAEDRAGCAMAAGMVFANSQVARLEATNLRLGVQAGF